VAPYGAIIFGKNVGECMHSFKLSDEFVNEYKDKEVKWGPMGEFTYLRTYSRNKDDGTKERWFETVRRVVEGSFTYQKKHCESLKLPWNNSKAQKSAKIMYDKIFNFKFLPPGRSLWLSGTKFVEEKGSASLNNCAFISTDDIQTRGSFAFTWAMDALMLGVGVGFDTKGAERVTIHNPKKDGTFVVPDSRDGWVESLGLVIDSFFHGKGLPVMDYSLVRPYGTPIKGFGGVASGPEPLKILHESIVTLLTKRIGQKIKSTDIVDIMNMVGKCVVAGNVRRCLPKDAKVHTKQGMVSIQDITVGTEVLTHEGYKAVTNVFIQGEQETIKIRTADGYLESTPNHRMAVLNGVDSFIWKEAKDLTEGDRLITTHQGVEGSITTLPPYTHEYKEADRTGIEITVPPLDDDMAWFLGQLHANGYLYKRNSATGGSSCLSLVVALDKLAMAEKFVEQVCRFSDKLNPSLKKRKGENSYIVKVHSDQLVTYLQDNFKTANTTIRVPECIWKAKQSVKIAYVAGVMDGDGCVKNRPIAVVKSVYPEFVYDLQNLLYSCGIGSRVDYSLVNNPKRLAKGWQPLYGLAIINGNAHNVLGACDLLINKIPKKTRYQRTNTYPKEWLTTLLTGPQKSEAGYHSNSIITYERASMYLPGLNYIPVKVLGIEVGNLVETFDIEVEDNHNFFCNGYLTHNSAEIAIGAWDDLEYTTMKSWEKHPEELQSHRWASNNSVFAEAGKTDYSKFVDGIALNGEPGIIWLDHMKAFSRTVDKADWKDNRALGTNPCGEQTLESGELCCLVETFPSLHDSVEEYMETLKYAYLYGKSVTLVPTHWPETNAIMLRNRRIGLSQSGIIDAFVKHGRHNVLNNFCDKGYNYIQKLDTIYSDWLCIPRSIKMTAVKPSGTVSLLAGVSPGIHYPHAEYYIRRIRVATESPLVKAMRDAGYQIEFEVYGDEEERKKTSIIHFPIHEKNFSKKKDDVSIWEQVKNTVDYQKYWADNNVSVTVTFKKEEANQIITVLEAFESELKSISFLPIAEHGYEMAPYQEITKEQYEEMASKIIGKPDFSEFLGGPAGSKFCDGDACEPVVESTGVKKMEFKTLSI
jgi:hypothetical protein